MSATPWVRFFPSDWLAGTRGMSAAETGIYITLIALMYERGEPVPEDHARLARLCGSTVPSFRKTLETLVDERKIVRVEGGLWNRRVGEESKNREEITVAAREKAHRRWNKKDNENNDGGMQGHGVGIAAADANHNHNHKSTEPDGSSDEKRAQARAAIEREFHDVFWPAWPNKTAKEAALKAWPGARAKADLETVMDGVRNYVRGKPPDRNWMNPATFLNGARWNDHHLPPISQRGNHAQSRKPNLDDRIADAFADRRARRGLRDPETARDRRELDAGGVSDGVLTLDRGSYRDASGR